MVWRLQRLRCRERLTREPALGADGALSSCERSMERARRGSSATLGRSEDRLTTRPKVSSGTEQRNRTAAIARTKPLEALALARRIDDPWFRCQALSIAAVHTPDRRSQNRAIEEAFASANELGDPNRVVTVSSWPIKALISVGQVSQLSSEVDRLLKLASTEASPVRRADALRYLLGGVSSAAGSVAGRVATAFAAACLAPLLSGKRNAKGESHLEECLPALARIDSDLARHILERLPPARSARAARAVKLAADAPLPELLPWPHFGAA
jgi:hypothetical protein